MSSKPILYHIPVCPFCQRLEIMLALKGQSDAVEFRVVDITKPRDPELLKKTDGTTALPVLETTDGTIIKESLVILRYLDSIIPGGSVAQTDPLKHAIENMLIAKESPFTIAGYSMVMNQDQSQRKNYEDKLLALYQDISFFLDKYNPNGTFLFDEFGLAEAVYTPMFMRFWFLDYFEGFELPDTPEYTRVAKWRDACLAHSSAQQTSKEEVVKVYYDYAKGAGNGALLPGRSKSSFVFEPDWRDRPWPDRDKYNVSQTDKELGLA
jgi:glutathione S-transferase